MQHSSPSYLIFYLLLLSASFPISHCLSAASPPPVMVQCSSPFILSSVCCFTISCHCSSRFPFYIVFCLLLCHLLSWFSVLPPLYYLLSAALPSPVTVHHSSPFISPSVCCSATSCYCSLFLLLYFIFYLLLCHSVIVHYSFSFISSSIYSSATLLNYCSLSFCLLFRHLLSLFSILSLLSHLVYTPVPYFVTVQHYSYFIFVNFLR